MKKSQRESFPNISPIAFNQLAAKPAKASLPQVEKFVDVELDDLAEFTRHNDAKGNARMSNGINLREEERQSLKSFEDFENTLLMLENNKNEDEFDDLLNRFSSKNVCTPMSQRVRQSLDNIKKRHSLINMEKQYQDELSREKTIPISSKAEPMDRNRLNEFINSSRTPVMVSSTSSNSSGERLLRRSRLYDDVLNMSTSSGSETETLNKRNQSYDASESQKTEEQKHSYSGESQSPKSDATETGAGNAKANHRDRFKTIRIFKKLPENAVQVPHVDDDADADEKKFTVVRPCDVAESTEHFSPKNVNPSPAHGKPSGVKTINTMTFRKSALSRPKHLSGLKLRNMYAKSNSHEILSTDDDFHGQHTESTAPPPLKSPLGAKSKSVHNLMSGHKAASGMGKPSASALPSGMVIVNSIPSLGASGANRSLSSF